MLNILKSFSALGVFMALLLVASINFDADPDPQSRRDAD